MGSKVAADVGNAGTDAVAARSRAVGAVTAVIAVGGVGAVVYEEGGAALGAVALVHGDLLKLQSGPGLDERGEGDLHGDHRGKDLEALVKPANQLHGKGSVSDRLIDVREGVGESL